MAQRIKGTRQVTFTVNVIGLTWGNGVCGYSYEFVTYPSEAMIKAKAGDFQSISDYEVVRVTVGGDWAHSWTRRKIVHPWSDEINGDTYMQLMELSA